MRLDSQRAEQFVMEATELQSSAPKLKSNFVLESVASVLNPILSWLTKVCFNVQHENTSIELQHHRAKYVRHHSRFFESTGIPEVLTSAEKCEGPCGNRVYMLVRSDKSLCFGCWGQSLKTLD
jgi:hypothetical protein